MAHSRIYWLENIITNISCTLFKRTIYDALLGVYRVNKRLYSVTLLRSLGSWWLLSSLSNKYLKFILKSSTSPNYLGHFKVLYSELLKYTRCIKHETVFPLL